MNQGIRKKGCVCATVCKCVHVSMCVQLYVRACVLMFVDLLYCCLVESNPSLYSQSSAAVIIDFNFSLSAAVICCAGR